jgi:hypothetical protein
MLSSSLPIPKRILALLRQRWKRDTPCPTPSDEGEELGGGEDLFIGTAVEGELLATFTHEYGTSGAPVLFGAGKDQLLLALFAREDDLLG